jgi:poly-beta-1,6-N-acetyl-D-glucosamine synthase
MIVLFWTCVGLIAYVYLGYPLLVRSGLLGRRRGIDRQEISPFVTFIVPAHNEEKSIAQKIENILALEYPEEQVEILVGDDGSTDRTAAIVDQYKDKRVRLVRGRRSGKSSIQNEMVKLAAGTIFIFTDADCLLPLRVLSSLLPNFADREVALVTNHAVFSNVEETDVTESEGLYLRYERWLRQQESERGLLAMASGSFFALRREFWRDLDPNVGDDFAIPLWVVQNGGRIVQEPRATAVTRLTQSDVRSYLESKVRVINKDLKGLLRNYALLNPFRFGAISIGLWSHKLLRWCVPYFLILLFAANLLLVRERPYGVLMTLELLFYAAALAGIAAGRKRLGLPWSAISSFCVVNAAALVGTLRCMTLRPAGQWKPIR